MKTIVEDTLRVKSTTLSAKHIMFLIINVHFLEGLAEEQLLISCHQLLSISKLSVFFAINSKFVYSIFSFMCMFRRLLFFFSFGHCVVDSRILITPLVSSNSSWSQNYSLYNSFSNSEYRSLLVKYHQLHMLCHDNCENPCLLIKSKF